MRNLEIRRKMAAALATLSLVAARHASAPPMSPLPLPEGAPIVCMDSKGRVGPMEDKQLSDATMASLEAAWAGQGYQAELFKTDDRSGMLRFRNTRPVADEFDYTVHPYDGGALAFTGVTIRQLGHVQRLTGTDVCVQLFDILHR